MIIGLCGPDYAGRSTVARYLTKELGFKSITTTALLFSEDPVDFARIVTPQENDTVSWHAMAQCWKSNVNVVVEDITRPCDHDVTVLFKRPFFLLVYVDAPLMERFKRAVAGGDWDRDALESFVRAYEERYTDRSSDMTIQLPNNASFDRTVMRNASQGRSLHDPLSLVSLQRQARLYILNNFKTVGLFYESLRAINFTATERLRPSWDAYFMSLATLAAERTNCMKRRVGCVIARNKRVIATGYNGTPSGVKNCSDGGCGRCNGVQTGSGNGLDLCLCLHAEENAIIEAGRERCEGSTLYTNLFPCILCAKKIVQAGITRIVFENHYALDDHASKSLLRAGGVVVEATRRTDNYGMFGTVLAQETR